MPSSDLRNVKVLVVDDNATSRNILQDMLESFSFDVTLAASGEEGLEEIQIADTQQPYELVLMDWKMPGMDGLEVSEQIKNHKTPGRVRAPCTAGRACVSAGVIHTGFESDMMIDSVHIRVTHPSNCCFAATS